MTDAPNLLKGTLDVLILRALESGPLHGYGVAEWIHGATDGDLLIEEGTLYPALHRLQRKGLIRSEWGRSENKRRARFYEPTDEGRRRLASDRKVWRTFRSAVDRALDGGTP